MTTYMDSFNKYEPILFKFGCTQHDVNFLFDQWSEPHRVYHDERHLKGLLDMIETHKARYNSPQYHILVATAFFHDAIYDPKRNDNEEKSAELFDAMCCNPEAVNRWDEVTNPMVQEVVRIILATKYDPTHKLEGISGSKSLTDAFLKMDLHGLIHHRIDKLIPTEELIFREYQFHDYNKYREGRLHVLKVMQSIVEHANPNNNLHDYIEYLRHKQRSIGVYAGSFFPFHNGHRDILEKAERVFDKVIVAFGCNPDKNPDQSKYQSYIKEFQHKSYRESETFPGFLTDYVQSKQSEHAVITLVKGLGRPGDFDNEKIQLRYMEDMDPTVQAAYFISDREWEYVSSSGIRSLMKMDGDTSMYLD
jgi:pantetheine-phosphate adenylyltransferase